MLSIVTIDTFVIMMYIFTMITRKGLAGGGAVASDNRAEIRIRQLPRALRKELRLAALEEDCSMNQLVIHILSAWIAKRRGP